jgi:hypothetical protein
MLGDDVASAGLHITAEAVQMTGKFVGKSAEIIAEIIKMISQMAKNKNFEVNGEQKMLSNLQKGGETDSVTLSKEDFEKFKEINKNQYKNNVAYFSVNQQSNSDFVDVHFLKSDDAAFKAILNDIVNEKLNLPNQEFKMVEMEKLQVEAFQEHCMNNNISANFMESHGKVRCIFNANDEQKIGKVISDMEEVRNELKNTMFDIKKDDNGRLSFVISDKSMDKSITMKFCDKEKLQRVLQEQFGYDKVKAMEAANAVSRTLSSEQERYYRSGSKLLEQMDYYEHNVKFENDNILTSDYTFTQLKVKGDEDMRLSITDKDGNYVILTQSNTDRQLAEDNIRKYLQINDTERINALLEKAEKLKFADPAKTIKRGEYTIERTSKNSLVVSNGNKSARIDISNTNSARNTLINSFGMSEKKADRIIEKGRKQSVTENLLNNARKLHNVSSDGQKIKNKHMNRGSRS